MASELAFAPAGKVRLFPAGLYWTGNPVGVGVWSFLVGWYCPDPTCGWSVKKKLAAASVCLIADAVVAMRDRSQMTAVDARKRAPRQGCAAHLL